MCGRYDQSMRCRGTVIKKGVYRSVKVVLGKTHKKRTHIYREDETTTTGTIDENMKFGRHKIWNNFSPPENVKAQQTGRGGARARCRRRERVCQVPKIRLAAARAHASPASSKGRLHVAEGILCHSVPLSAVVVLGFHAQLLLRLIGLPTNTTSAMSTVTTVNNLCQFYTKCR